MYHSRQNKNVKPWQSLTVFLLDSGFGNQFCRTFEIAWFCFLVIISHKFGKYDIQRLTKKINMEHTKSFCDKFNVDKHLRGKAKDGLTYT